MKLFWQHKQQVEEFTVEMKLRTKFDMIEKGREEAIKGRKILKKAKVS